jgi:adenosylcobinamide kinase/adenosylcobinamide-phosphate guanylyltransferase
VRTLVLGASRSGKSAFAESLLGAEPAVEYVATAVPDRSDHEWADRIARHRARRPKHWSTIETGEVALVLVQDGPPVLVDSITTWLAGTMDETHAWSGGPSRRLDERVTELLDAWNVTDRRTVLVSDEVGWGVVPESRSGRRFRDELGTLNQALAALADEVVLVVAGLPMRLK